ncbi:MAG: threonyl-tRNA synthetase editing domain-containing protein [bacterium]
MRLLRFEGSFGYQKDEVHEGLILFCNFEDWDNENIFKKAINEIDFSEHYNIIIVPFAHLSENKLDKKKALSLFDSYVRMCKKITNKNIITKPFGRETEFNLTAPADDKAIRFMHFDKKYA